MKKFTKLAAVAMATMLLSTPAFAASANSRIIAILPTSVETTVESRIIAILPTSATQPKAESRIIAILPTSTIK